MGLALANSRTIETRNGGVTVYGAVPPQELAGLKMDQSLRMFRPPDRQQEALITIAGLEHGAVMVARHADTIVGYCTFHPCDSSSRYGRSGLPVLELGAIEVAASWRFMRIGRSILEVSFDAGPLDDYIVMSTEYAWHWDLESTRLSVWQYRKLLYDILSNVGLLLVKTDDPEVTSHPANMLTVRYGIRVPADARERFEACCLPTPSSAG